MLKNRTITLRLAADELAEIDRICKGLSISRSAYLHAAAVGSGGANLKNRNPAPAAPLDESRIERIEADLVDLVESQKRAAASFEALLQNLNELHRTPSFREHRARAAAEGVERRESETDDQYLLRLAARYFVVHHVWPDAGNPKTFGPISPGTSFPKSPPAGL